MSVGRLRIYNGPSVARHPENRGEWLWTILGHPPREAGSTIIGGSRSIGVDDLAKIGAELLDAGHIREIVGISGLGDAEGDRNSQTTHPPAESVSSVHMEVKPPLLGGIPPEFLERVSASLRQFLLPDGAVIIDNRSEAPGPAQNGGSVLARIY